MRSPNGWAAEPSVDLTLDVSRTHVVAPSTASSRDSIDEAHNSQPGSTNDDMRSQN